MQQFTHFIGIDISKKHIDLVILCPAGKVVEQCQLTNTSAKLRKGLAKLAQEFEFELHQAFFCIEATGVYGKPLLIVAAELDLTIGVEPAWKIKSNLHHRGKTDQTDAHRIADYVLRFHDGIRHWQPESEFLLQLRHLLAMRQQLVDTKRRYSVPMKEAKSLENKVEYQIRKRFAPKMIKEAEQQIKELESEIDELIKGEALAFENFKLLTSIPGVGRQTAFQLILITQNFTRFENAKQLACFGGVAPFKRESGSSIKGKAKVSHKANKKLKYVLHMAAMAAVTHNPELRNYFARKVGLGKNKMLVINAVRNKLLHIVFAVIKRRTPYIQSRTSEQNSVA